MGNFLDKPETCKSFDCRQGNDLACGVASMQGWRREMEVSGRSMIWPALISLILTTKSELRVPKLLTGRALRNYWTSRSSGHFAVRGI